MQRAAHPAGVDLALHAVASSLVYHCLVPSTCCPAQRVLLSVMGAFENLFKRRSAKTATPGAAETSKTKSPVDDRSSGVATSGLLRKTSSKSKKASNIGASAGIDVPAVPPRVDLGILRTPSPPLVQVHVEGYRSDSPWVDLAAQTEPRRGSFGFGSYRTSSSSPTTRAVDDKLLEYLHGKLITPEQATLLVQECTKALQGQGRSSRCFRGCCG